MEEWEVKLRKTKGSLILTIHNTSTFHLKLTAQKFENVKCTKKHTLNEIAPGSTQKIGAKLLEKNKSREGTFNLSWQAQPTKSNTHSTDTNVIVMVHLHVKMKSVETGHTAEVNAEIFPPHGLTHQIQPEPDMNCLLYTLTLRDESVSTKPDVVAVVEAPIREKKHMNPTPSSSSSALSTQHTVPTSAGSSHSRKPSRVDVSSEVSGSVVGTSTSATTTTTTTTPTTTTTIPTSPTTLQRSDNLKTSQSDQPAVYCCSSLCFSQTILFH
jgi:hypothetical protein